MSTRCRVAVGSLNPVKVNAVRRAFRILCDPLVEGVDVPSGVPAQPIGLREIILGALNRALRARSIKNADYGVGIEAGAVFTEVEPIELQVAVVVDRGERVSLGVSQAFPLPRAWVSELQKRTELEEIVVRHTGRTGIGEKLGLVGYLSYGLVTRTDLSYNAVLMALIPRLNMSLYSSLLTAREVYERLGERT